MGLYTRVMTDLGQVGSRIERRNVVLLGLDYSDGA
jgi:hypothetical protein